MNSFVGGLYAKFVTPPPALSAYTTSTHNQCLERQNYIQGSFTQNTQHLRRAISDAQGI